jgi:hypothetical protein
MFTPDERESIRAELIETARGDTRISGIAVTGSASVGKQDAWSDIDLAFGIRDLSNVASALADFSARMYDKYGALHHLDVPSGSWIYRVFMLKNTLQVDLAFAPEEDFGARGPAFKLLFGEAKGGGQSSPSNAEELIGMGWLYALHTRSSVARNKSLQAEYMISAMRDQVLSLACIRNNLPAHQGRGLDGLPPDIVSRVGATLVRSLDVGELKRAFEETTKLFVEEIRCVDPRLAVRLEPTLQALATPIT